MKLPRDTKIFFFFFDAAIPFIVHPIDNGIHAIMNFSLRPTMKRYICGPGQGSLAELNMCNEECDVSNKGKNLPVWLILQ